MYHSAPANREGRGPLSARLERCHNVDLHPAWDVALPVADTFVVPPHIRLAVFDLDGTLVTHAYPHWCREAARIFPVLGLENVTVARVRRDFSAGDMFAALPPDHRDRLVEEFWTLYDEEGAPYPRCLPGVRRTLGQMKASGLRVAIATARLERSAALMPRLKRWGLDRFVDFTLTRLGPDDKTYSSKVPVLLQLLERARASGEDALMVGDTPADIECARLAGYSLQIAVCSGGLTPATLAEAAPTAILKAASSLTLL